MDEEELYERLLAALDDANAARQAHIKEQQDSIRNLKQVLMTLYGFYTQQIELIEAGKLDEALAILKEYRDGIAERVINR